jgi:hypothetical protein
MVCGILRFPGAVPGKPGKRSDVFFPSPAAPCRKRYASGILSPSRTENYHRSLRALSFGQEKTENMLVRFRAWPTLMKRKNTDFFCQSGSFIPSLTQKSRFFPGQPGHPDPDIKKRRPFPGMPGMTTREYLETTKIPGCFFSFPGGHQERTG